MKSIRFFFLSALLFIFNLSVFGQQRPEVTLTLNEAFMDAAIDAVLQKGEPPSIELREQTDPACRESIRVVRETNGVRTTVRFREGRIIAPIAFVGNYKMPIIGCVDISGWAEAIIDLELDSANQRILARVRVKNVSLNGTGGVGSALVARLVQSSIDQMVNPIEIIKLEKLSFAFPIQTAGSLRLIATGFRYTVQPGSVNLHVSYEFIRT